MAGVALLAGAVASAYFGLRAVNETLRVERLALRLFADIEGLQGALKDAEALESEFLLTGEPALTARFDTLRAKIIAYSADLGKRVEHPEQRAALPALTIALLERLDAVTQTLQDRNNRGPAEALRRAYTPDRTALTRRAERLLDEASKRQQRIVAVRESAAAEDLGFLERGALVGILLAIALLGWSLRAGRRQELAREAAEAGLQARSRELRLLVDAVPAMISYVDTAERYLLHNRAYAEWLGIPSGRIDGRTVREVVGEAEYEQVRPHLARALAGDEVHYDRSQRHADGSTRDLAVAYVPHFGPARSVLGCYALLTDITNLKQLSRAKSEFVSMVSHELRTPATAMLGALGLVAGGAAGPVPEPVGRLVEIANGAGGRLLKLLDDILDIEKIESGEIPLDLRDAELKELIEPALAVAGPIAARKGVHLETAGVVPAATLRTDAARVSQVLGNLLTNAIQFSPDGAAVAVGVQAGEGRCRISIRDHGPGVSEDFRPLLFQKFSQAPGAERGRTGRSGLGLAISKMLVERLGGRVGYEPAASGGSVFWFELPLAGPGDAQQTEAK
ncbi:MAG: ATP-binding protein [Betaproteobacteria bacterium]